MPAGVTLSEIADAFRGYGFRGQIVGPHGSGKSTLIYHLLRQLETSFRQIDVWTIQQRAHGWQRSNWRRDKTWVNPSAAVPHRNLVVVEGWEQLRWVERRWSSSFGFLKSRFLLLTGHREWPGRLPVLARLEPDEARFVELCHRLQRGCARPLSTESMRRAFQRQGGDCREAFFDLYDEFESAGCYT